VLTANRQGKSALDTPTLMMYIALVSIGWIMIYSVEYDPQNTWAFLDLEHSAGKQLFFIVFCAVLYYAIQLSDWLLWRTLAFVFYVVSCILLVGTIFLGREINGAQAWYQIAGFTFQPAEIAKFATALAISAYLSSTGIDLRTWRTRLTAVSIFILPILIILLQKDTGSALVFFSFMLVLYREGLASSWYTLGFGAAAVLIFALIYPPVYVVVALLIFFNIRMILPFRERTVWYIAVGLLVLISLFWKDIFDQILKLSHLNLTQVPFPQQWILLPHLILFIILFFRSYWRKNTFTQRRLQLNLLILVLASGMAYAANYAVYSVLAPHQQTRIRIWLRPSEITDTRGAAYNLLNSRMAIGSGGVLGKGLMEGEMTRLKFVPEQSTDFIFCTVGEEHGFLGVVGLIGLFTALLIRITQLAERQRSNFSRIYAYCIAGILFAHMFINISMTMGLFPIIGIPLPFISYGGSSLIGFTLMIGVLLKLDYHRHSA
jgi:rod shape determining protein RodA